LSPTIIKLVIKENLEKQFYLRIKSILKSKLNGNNLIKAVNTYAVPLLTYSFGVIKWSKTNLQNLNIKTRVLFTKFSKHHPKVNGVKMMALVDTGSDFNLITLTSFLDLGAPNFERKEITFTGFGRGLVKALGQFEAVLKIDQASFKTILHVVPDGEMPIDMTLIVGKPILMHVTLMANAEKIEVVPRPTFKDEKGSRDEPLTEENAVMLLRPEEEELDIGGSKHEKEIKKMVENYTPKATKKTNVIMKIILQDEEPIFQSPRRLSISEKREVDELIQQ
jgi:hypothetical protein